jgi:hypothetical protein
MALQTITSPHQILGGLKQWQRVVCPFDPKGSLGFGYKKYPMARKEASYKASL